MRKANRLPYVFFLVMLTFTLQAQEPASPIFVNEGETVVYHISRDPGGQKGTLSDALQNVPGVKVDTEGHITLRGVSEVEVLSTENLHISMQKAKKTICNKCQQPPSIASR